MVAKLVKQVSGNVHSSIVILLILSLYTDTPMLLYF